jgi:hypothetical protein
MSKKSDEIAARRAALGLKVISNESLSPTTAANVASPERSPSNSVQDHLVGTGFERRRPPGTEITARSGVPSGGYYRATFDKPSPITVAAVNGNSDDIEVKASTYAQWLEEQYHANITPFAFLSDVALNVDNLPDDMVVEKACEMMRAKGWHIDVHYFNSAGCRAGSVTMMHPHSVGF